MARNQGTPRISGFLFLSQYREVSKGDRGKYKAEAKRYKAAGNSTMEGLCGAFERGIKVVMNGGFGLSIQQGTSIPAILDLNNDSLADIELRQSTYQKVAKEFKNKDSTHDERQCFSRKALETITRIRSLFMQKQLALEDAEQTATLQQSNKTIVATGIFDSVRDTCSIGFAGDTFPCGA